MMVVRMGHWLLRSEKDASGGRLVGRHGARERGPVGAVDAGSSGCS